MTDEEKAKLIEVRDNYYQLTKLLDEQRALLAQMFQICLVQLRPFEGGSAAQMVARAKQRKEMVETLPQVIAILEQRKLSTLSSTPSDGISPTEH